MAARHTQNGPQQPLRAQKGQKQPRAPRALRAPPAEEEDPRVKCRDCGAFGHKAMSVRCPMKRWDGALAPQPLGSHKMKENQKVCIPRDQGNPAPTARPAGEKEKRPSQEDQQRQALLQRLPRRPLGRLQPAWMDETESCDYVRHPTRPMPVYRTQRRCVGDPGLTSRSPVWNPDMTSTVSPIHRAERSTFSPRGLSKGQGVPVTASRHPAGTGSVQAPGSKSHGEGRALIPQAQAKHPKVKSASVRHPAAYSSGQDSKVGLKAPGKRAAQSPVETCQNPRKRPRLGPCPLPQKRTPRAGLGCVQPHRPPARAPVLRPVLAPQVPRKTSAQGQSMDLQPPHKAPVLSTLYTCLESQHPQAPQGTGQSLRMVFTRLHRGQWSSRFLTTPSVPPAEEQAPPAQRPLSPVTSEGPCAHVPCSFLYEDLQVSSSSEDSDGQ